MPHSSSSDFKPTAPSPIGFGRGLARVFNQLKAALRVQLALKNLERERGFLDTMPAPGVEWHEAPALGSNAKLRLRTRPPKAQRQAMSSTRAQLLEGTRPHKNCPVCSGELARANRRPVDRLISYLVPVHRYRCVSFHCGWVGNIRLVKPAGTNPLRWRIATGSQAPALFHIWHQSRH